MPKSANVLHFASVQRDEVRVGLRARDVRNPSQREERHHGLTEGWSHEDDGTLIVAETLAARLTAFDIQPDGSLANRRVWAQVEPSPEPAETGTMLSAVSFAPDGCALDAEGHVWAANALGGPVSRVAPGGRIVDEVAVPEGLGVFACGLGGEDGRTLIACAAPDFDEQARAAAREGCC